MRLGRSGRASRMHIEHPASSRGWMVNSDKREHTVALTRRAMDQSRWTFVAIFAGIAVAIILFIAYILYQKRRRNGGSRHTQQKPQGLTDRIRGFWRTDGGQYQQTPDSESHAASHPLSSTTNANTAAPARAAATVDRNTSIRSVITLPAYRQAASHEERVLGREGERGGVDVIVDLPTQEDEEALREQEMDTMYQIRLARRQQLADREERRRLQREAEARRDQRALSALRAQGRGDTSRENIRELRETVDRLKDNRQRSVSSVSYADLGVARHDGSRVRANSNESERMGLLSDAASIAASSRPGAQSPQPSHLRAPSSCSVLSNDSDMASPHYDQQGGYGSDTPRGSIGGFGGASSPHLQAVDVDDETNRPPEYEDVTLDDNERGRASPDYRSTTPLNEPPPDYERTSRSNSATRDRLDAPNSGSEASAAALRRGVDGSTPQLPSLRLGRLPSIVIEPSSAPPRDDER